MQCNCHNWPEYHCSIWQLTQSPFWYYSFGVNKICLRSTYIFLLIWNESFVFVIDTFLHCAHGYCSSTLCILTNCSYPLQIQLWVSLEYYIVCDRHYLTLAHRSYFTILIFYISHTIYIIWLLSNQNSCKYFKSNLFLHSVAFVGIIIVLSLANSVSPLSC